MNSDRPPRRRPGEIFAIVLLSGVATVPTIPASAQTGDTDIVVMRRVITAANRTPPTYSLRGQAADPVMHPRASL